ncbi:MAG: hypothetical protein ACRD0P_19515 [Stackebrandtia sp.]
MGMRGLILSAASAALLLSACGSQAPSAAEVDRAFTERAKKVSAQWHDSGAAREWGSGLKLVDRAIHLPKDWPDAQYFDEPSLMAGNATLDAELPADSPPGTVKLPGTDTDVEVWDAREAYDVLIDDGSGGSPFTVTGVEAATAPWFTNHGFVDLPVWKYTVDGYAEPVVQVAFDAGDVLQPPDISEPDGNIPGTTAAAGLDAADGTTLDFDVSAGCLSGFAPLVFETDELVLLGGTGRKVDDQCTPEYESVTVTLDREVGNRVIIDAIDGKVLRFNEIYPA